MFNTKGKSFDPRMRNKVHQPYSNFSKNTRQAGDALDIRLTFVSKSNMSPSPNENLTFTEYKTAQKSLKRHLQENRTVGAVPDSVRLDQARNTTIIVFRFEPARGMEATGCAQQFLYQDLTGGHLVLDIRPPQSAGAKQTAKFKLEPYDKRDFHTSHWRSIAAIGKDDVVLETQPLPGARIPFSAEFIGTHITEHLSPSYEAHLVIRDTVGTNNDPLTMTIFSKVNPARLHDMETQASSGASEASSNASQIEFLHHLLAVENKSIVSLDSLVGENHFHTLAPSSKYDNITGVLSTIAMAGKFMREDLKATGCTMGANCNQRHRKELCNSHQAIRARVAYLVNIAEKKASKRRRGNDDDNEGDHSGADPSGADKNKHLREDEDASSGEDKDKNPKHRDRRHQA